MGKQNATAAAARAPTSEELARPDHRARRVPAPRRARAPRAEANVERVLDASLRLNGQRSSEKMHAALVEEVTQLLAPQRVMLVLESDVRRSIAASRLPAGEDPGALLQAVGPWLDEA